MKRKVRIYHEGEERIRKGFLFFPKYIKISDDYWESRWLERAVWKEQYTTGYNLNSWDPVEWIDAKNNLCA